MSRYQSSKKIRRSKCKCTNGCADDVIILSATACQDTLGNETVGRGQKSVLDLIINHEIIVV